MSLVLTHRDGDVAVIALNRPDVLNALTSPLRAELLAALRATQNARCVVLTGMGRGFCAGQDLTEAGAALDVGPVLEREYVPILHAILDHPAPVVAAVNGVAAGAGASLALACDIVVAAESASLAIAFSRIGLMPDAGGTWMLPRALGLPRALALTLLGESIPARQAAGWGLIWQAIPDAEFETGWQALARRLAAGPTAAYREARVALKAAFERDLSAQLAAEAEGQGRLGASADFMEGCMAFAGKRAPRFTGT